MAPAPFYAIPTSSQHLSPSPVIYGATRTTTYTTTLTASTSQSLITLAYPFPAITHPPPFTTITRTASIVSKEPPDPFVDTGNNDLPILETVTLPVMVLTMAEGIVVDMRGRRLTLGSLVQTVSGGFGPQETVLAVSGRGTGSCEGNGFDCWTGAQKIGSMVAVAVVGVGVLLLIVFLAKKCVVGVKKSDGDSLSCENERGHDDGGRKGDSGGQAAGPWDPLKPMALVPQDDDGGEVNQKGVLFLWRKKRILQNQPRSTSTTAVYSSYHPPNVYVAPTAATIPTIATPAGDVQYTPLPHHFSGSQQPTSTRDFAYRVDPSGIQLINPAPPIATIDADSSEQERRRHERRLRREQNDTILNSAAGGLKDRRSEEQKAYDKGHRRRRRQERSRSQMSESYDRRGDRLRKESPEAKEGERAARRQERADANKLRARRKSSEGQSAGDRARNTMLGFPRDSVRGRHRKSGSAGVNRDFQNRGDRSTDHVYDIANAEEPSLLRRGSKYNRYYPPMTNSRSVKHGGSYMQNNFDDLGGRGSFDQNPEKLDVRLPHGDSARPSRSQSARRRRQPEDLPNDEDDSHDLHHFEGTKRGTGRDERRRKYREHSPRELPNLSPRRRASQEPEEKEKRIPGGKTAKITNLLPIALAAIDALAEPSGGWQQFHKKDNKHRRRSSSVDNTHERHRRRRQPRKHHLRGSSLDRGISRHQENNPIQSTEADYLDSHPTPAPNLSRKHVKVVRQERSSDATIVRGGGEGTAPTKRVRISEQWGARSCSRSSSR